jgi:hypothetical protein
MPAEGSIASRDTRRRIGTPRFKEAFFTLSLFTPIFNGISLVRRFLFRGAGGISRTIDGSGFRRLTHCHKVRAGKDPEQQTPGAPRAAKSGD